MKKLFEEPKILTVVFYKEDIMSLSFGTEEGGERGEVGDPTP